MGKKKEHRNIRDSYEKYKTVGDELVDEDTYTQINKFYMKFLIAKALQGDAITLPARLGTLSVEGKKINPKLVDGKIVGLAPDWQATKKLWERNPEAKEQKKLVYCTNEATDGIRYKWVWSKFNSIVENKNLYTLILTRENKRLVHHRAKEKNNFKVKY